MKAITRRPKMYLVYSKNKNDDSVLIWGHEYSHKAACKLGLSFEYDCSLYVLSATWFKRKYAVEYKEYLTKIKHYENRV